MGTLHPCSKRTDAHYTRESEVSTIKDAHPGSWPQPVSLVDHLEQLLNVLYLHPGLDRRIKLSAGVCRAMAELAKQLEGLLDDILGSFVVCIRAGCHKQCKFWHLAT